MQHIQAIEKRLDAVLETIKTTLTLHCFNCGTRYKVESTNKQWKTCPNCNRNVSI